MFRGLVGFRCPMGLNGQHQKLPTPFWIPGDRRACIFVGNPGQTYLGPARFSVFSLAFWYVLRVYLGFRGEPKQDLP